MTLRTRLLLLSLATVAVIVVTLLTMHMNSLMTASINNIIDRSDNSGRQIQAFMRRRIEERLMARSVLPSDQAELRKIYESIIEEDEDLAAMLIEQMVGSRAIVEILIANEAGITLVSSNPAQTGKPMISRPELIRLRDENPISRITTVLTAQNDYESRTSFGDAGNQRALFTIQILVSPILMKAALLPELKGTSIVALLSLIVAMLLAYASARLAMRPIQEIGDIIDRLAQGESIADISHEKAQEKEVALVESKLNFLSEQFQNTQRDAESRRLAAMSSLTSGVAHEIKNPLNSIALRLELVRAHIENGSDSANDELDIVAQEVTRLDRVVKTFLDFTRPLELAMEEVDPTVLSQDVLNFIQPEAESRSIQLKLVPPQKPIHLRGDQDLLKQAMMNIVKNALEAMEKDGQLTVTIENKRGECEIRIHDTGPGIPTEIQQKIFNLYFSTKETGNGIGLAMTFRAIQLHGGSITIESEAGKGTTFQLRLPVHKMETRA